MNAQFIGSTRFTRPKLLRASTRRLLISNALSWGTVAAIHPVPDTTMMWRAAQAAYLATRQDMHEENGEDDANARIWGNRVCGAAHLWTPPR